MLVLLLGAANAGDAAGGQSFANTANLKIHYLDQGRGDTAVVLIHGWSCDHAFWREQIPALASKYRVIALDLPGHGQSDKPAMEYTQELFIDAVITVLNRAGVKQAVVVGHSMGAAIARRVALREPGRVIALISLDGALEYPPQDKAGHERWINNGQAFVRPFLGPQGEAHRARYMDSVHHAQTPASIRDWVRRRAAATPWPVALSALRNFIKPENWDARPLDKPALIIFAKSQYLTPEMKVNTGKLFPKMEYRVIDGVGHFPMLEKPDQVNQLMLGFLARVAPAN